MKKNTMNRILMSLAILIPMVAGLACGVPQSGQTSDTIAPLPTARPMPTVAPTQLPPMPILVPLTPTRVPVGEYGYAGFFIDAEDDVVYIYMIHPSQEGAEHLGKTRIANAVYEGTR